MSILTVQLPVSVGIPGAIYEPAQENTCENILQQQLQELFDPTVMLLSDNRPESLILGPSELAAGWLADPSEFFSDEVLDWDAAIEVAPRRPSGMLMVTLKYAGRGVPAPAEDAWD